MISRSIAAVVDPRPGSAFEVAMPRQYRQIPSVRRRRRWPVGQL